MRRASVDMTGVGHVYSVGFDLVPSDAVSFGMKYGWEKYTALLASRMANPLPADTEQYFSDRTQQLNDFSRAQST